MHLLTIILLGMFVKLINEQGENVVMNYEEIMDKVVKKLKCNVEEIGENFIHNEINGKYCTVPVNDWVTGFYPGLLWEAYKYSKYEKFKDIAISLEDKLDEAINNFDLPGHDVGFVWLLTSGINYKLTGNEKSKRRLLNMATCLAGRFNIKGNFIRAWESEEYKELVCGLAIIDCMMNIPLLFWASEETGDARFAHIANAHAHTVLKYFIDEDGAVRHQCRFNAKTGEFIEALGGQGYDSTSSWSRGAGWAIYGFAMAYRYTKKEEYLEASKKVAKFFISQIQDDYIPAWDFRAPNKEIKDTSAGALAASGMLELANFVDDKEYFIENSKRILEEMVINCSNLDNDNQAILNRATVHYPAGLNIEVGIIYADYYFVEALNKIIRDKYDLPWE